VEGREVSIVSLSEHYSQKAIDLLMNRLAPEMLRQNPDEVLFLIEGDEGIHGPEVAIYKEFAKQRNIQIEDPIINPYNHAIASLAGVDILKAAVMFILAKNSQ